MKHLMIDIEAFGLEPGHAIFELGAVVFDLETGETGAEFHADIEPCLGLIDPATERWHRERGTYPQPGQVEQIHPRDAFVQFRAWVEQHEPFDFIWSWGSTYDFPMLEAIWKLALPRQELPWPYYIESCARQEWRKAFPDVRHADRPHKAIPDCHAAIRDLVKANRHLAAGARRWKPIETAPKDGTKILALLSDSDVPHAVYWKDRYGWRIAWDGYDLSEQDGPTRWMPLPDAPESRKKEGQPS